MDVEISTYTVGADSLYESLNIQHPLFSSILNWFRSYEEPLVDDVFDRWGFANHT